jgi:NADPH2:quinone reductase
VGHARAPPNRAGPSALLRGADRRGEQEEPSGSRAKGDVEGWALCAIRVHEFGGPEVLTLDEVSLPAPGPGEVRVRLRAVGVNPVERAIRTGAFARPALPFIPGSDGAGDVTAVGAGVTKVRPGDRVYVNGAPTYAEEVNAPEAAVWPLPESVGYEEGAAIGIPYVTAYRALFLVTALAPGDAVLVHGAAGGVGTAAVQLARSAGLAVVGTSSHDEGRRHILAQGAAAAFDHDDEEGLLAATGGRGYRLIVEMRATGQIDRDLRLLEPFGVVVVVGQAGPTAFQPGLLMAKTATLCGIAGPSPPPTGSGCIEPWAACSRPEPSAPSSAGASRWRRPAGPRRRFPRAASSARWS